MRRIAVDVGVVELDGAAPDEMEVAGAVEAAVRRLFLREGTGRTTSEPPAADEAAPDDPIHRLADRIAGEVGALLRPSGGGRHDR